MKDDERTDWDRTNKALARQKGEKVLPVQSDTVGPPAPIPGETAPPVGLIAKIRSGGIKRNAALATLKEWHEGQLEVARHQIAEAVKVKKAEATGIAEQILSRIDDDRIAYLRTLGLVKKVRTGLEVE